MSLLEKTHYPLRYRLDNKDRFLIWFTVDGAGEDLDGVVLNQKGEILVFRSREEVFSYCDFGALEVERDYDCLHNFDVVIRWMKRKKSKWFGATAIDCKEFLDTWNLFGDISRSLDGDFDSDRERTSKIYDKLFYGANPPAITPKGEHYTPYWPNKEKRIIRDVLSHGLQMFRNHLRLYR
jgi:hypothetical protein